MPVSPSPSQRRRRPNRLPEGEGVGGPFAWATQLALFIAIALVLARAMMLEILRDPFQVEVGQQPYPRGPGATAALVLDLLCCIPAILVLMRAVLDRGYAIRRSLANRLALLLGLWTILSPLWASDKFAAAVGAAHWFSAIVLLWSVSQLVRDWRRLRLVAAAMFGLLLVQCAHGIIYRFVDLPELQASVEEQWQQILRERGWEPDSFLAQQFKRRITGGEIIGFNASPNTYGAIVVTLAIVSAGLTLQRWRDGDEWGWPLVIALGVAPAALVLYFTRSRTAFATPLLGAALLAAAWMGREWLARHRRLAYFGAVGGVLAVMGAIVAHGLWHGTLFHASLTFRWNYWVGATRVFLDHPLLGVGFGNFGLYYLGARLPAAAEEINDPHNFIVRLFVELGILGGLLLLAWMLRMWWELTLRGAPVAPEPEAPPPVTVIGGGHGSLARLLQLAAAATLVAILAGVDLSQQWQYGFIEVLKRLLYMLLLIIGLAVGTFRSSRQQEMDDRPAPLLLYAMIVAVAIFLVHNLVDFSLFETGPLFVFAMLVGAVLGTRLSGDGRPLQRGAAVVLLVAAVVAWLAAAIGVAAPVAVAERSAQRADDELRVGQAASAATRLREAFDSLWIPNADYAYRAARAMISAGYPPDDIRTMISAAIAASPANAAYPRLRAQFELKLARPNLEQIVSDYQRVIELDPNELSARLEYAEVLERSGRPEEAVRQYRRVLELNERFDPAEPERLTPGRIEQVRQHINRLETDRE